MTETEKAHREFYAAMRSARAGMALRLCNRMPKRKAARRVAPALPIVVEAPAV